MAGAQTSEVDTLLHKMSDDPTVVGYVVLNADGIPVKHHDKMPYETAVTYATLISDFHMKARKCLRELLSGADSELSNFRMRTKEGTEIIAVNAAEYILVVIQNCTGEPWVYPEADAAGGGGE